LKRKGCKTTKEIIESAFYDKDKKLPIFNEKTAKQLLKAFKQKGGRDTKYPFTDVAIKGVLRDYTPGIVGGPISSVYGAVTGTVDTLKNSIPFADLALESVHAGTELGVTSANDLGQVAAGPVGALAVAPFTGVLTAFTTALSAGEGDLGGAVGHIANWVPGIGSALSKIIEKGEHMAKTLKNHETISSYLPYMSEYHRTLEESLDEVKDSPTPALALPDTPSTDLVTAAAAGKRLSTMRHKSNKWRKTQRKRFATR
jgi:hypothetical protein